jgi:hypothetical protein
LIDASGGEAIAAGGEGPVWLREGREGEADMDARMGAKEG